MGSLFKIAGLTALCALTLSAGTVGPNCATCYGGVYSLDGTLLNSGALTETWRYTYTVDTTGITSLGSSTYIASLAAQVSSTAILAITSVNPTAGNWSVALPNVGASSIGCTDPGFGWACIQYLSGDKIGLGANGGTYQWVFDVLMVKGSALSDVSIEANFDPTLTKFMSGTIHTPEGVPTELPVTLSLLGVWMLWQRRKLLSSLDS